jgi:hypothetical protein
MGAPHLDFEMWDRPMSPKQPNSGTQPEVRYENRIIRTESSQAELARIVEGSHYPNDDIS